MATTTEAPPAPAETAPTTPVPAATPPVAQGPTLFQKVRRVLDKVTA